MRTCATAHAIFTVLAAGVWTFAACSGSQTPEAGAGPEPPAPTAEPEPEASHPVKPTENAEASSVEGDAAGPDAADQKSRAAIMAAKCSDPMVSMITGKGESEVPEKGVVMNNAQPNTKDKSGNDAKEKSDRFQPIIEVISKKRPVFRCCFDLWSKENPGKSGSVTLSLHLDPKGRVLATSWVPGASTLEAPLVGECIAQTARKLEYPSSPSGKETTLNYPFKFNAKANP